MDVIQSYINHVKEVNPAINACVDERFRDALADAQAVDVMIQSEKLTQEQLAAEFPLLGVPFTCKEVIGVQGMSFHPFQNIFLLVILSCFFSSTVKN